MKLIAIAGTLTQAQSIDLLTYNGNRFANVNKFGKLKLYGEDMNLLHDELKKVIVIADNFKLFFDNLMTLQIEIKELNKEILFTLTPTLSRQ
jgi:hypothetical protein